MKTRFLMCLTISILLCSACSDGSSTPTSDFDATLEIALEQTIAAQPTNTSTITPTSTVVPTSTNTPNPSPTPTVTDEVKSYTVETLDNGLSRYSYQEAGFSIALPHSWQHLDLSTDDLDQMLSHATENNQQLEDFISSTYLRNLVAAGIKFMAVDTSKDSLAAGIPTSINILTTDLPIEISFDDYVEVNVQQLISVMGENLIILQDRIQIDNTEAEKLTYEAELNDVFGKSHIVVFNQFLILQGRTQYILTFGTVKEFSKANLEVFSDIAQSFDLAE